MGTLRHGAIIGGEKLLGIELNSRADGNFLLEHLMLMRRILVANSGPRIKMRSLNLATLAHLHRITRLVLLDIAFC